MPAKKSSKLNPPAPLEIGSRSASGRTREDARFTAPPSLAGLPDSYGTTLEEIKSHLRSARVRAVLAANPIVIEAYWHTGKIILQRQQEAAWGAKVIDRLSADLRDAFPDMRGLSTRNLLAMKIFAREFPDPPIAQQPVAQLSWGNPSPWRIGKPNSPRPSLRNSKAASPASKKSKPNSPATSQQVANLDCQLNPNMQNLKLVIARSPKISMCGTAPFPFYGQN